MSHSWRSALRRLVERRLLRVYMTERCLTICAIRGRVRPHVVHQVQLHYLLQLEVQPVCSDTALHAETTLLAPALSAMNAWWTAHPQYADRADVECIVSPAFARLIVLPRDPELAQAKVREAVAAALLSRQFQEDPARYDVRFHMGAVDEASLAVFLPSELTRELASLVRRHGGRLTCLTPTLMLVWTFLAAQLKKQHGVLNLMEEDRLTCMVYRHGQLSAIEIRPFDMMAVAPMMPLHAAEDSLSQVPVLRLHRIAPGVMNASDREGYWLTPSHSDGVSFRDALAYAYACCGVA